MSSEEISGSEDSVAETSASRTDSVFDAFFRATFPKLLGTAVLFGTASVAAVAAVAVAGAVAVDASTPTSASNRWWMNEPKHNTALSDSATLRFEQPRVTFIVSLKPRGMTTNLRAEILSAAAPPMN
jgi:hypothetical protein